MLFLRRNWYNIYVKYVNLCVYCSKLFLTNRATTSSGKILLIQSGDTLCIMSDTYLEHKHHVVYVGTGIHIPQIDQNFGIFGRFGLILVPDAIPQPWILTPPKLGIRLIKGCSFI